MSSTWEQILDGMVAELAPIAIQQGGAEGNGRYVRHLGRYLGEFDSEDAMRTIAGRCPAVLVDFAGEKPATETIGRKSQAVDVTFLAICASDSHRSRQDRDRLFAVLRDVRRLLVGRRLGLTDISPLAYRGILTLVEKPQIFAYAAKLETTLHYDWTRPPAGQTQIEVVEGTVRTGNPPETVGGLRRTY